MNKTYCDICGNEMKPAEHGFPRIEASPVVNGAVTSSRVLFKIMVLHDDGDICLDCVREAVCPYVEDHKKGGS